MFIMHHLKKVFIIGSERDAFKVFFIFLLALIVYSIIRMYVYMFSYLFNKLAIQWLYLSPIEKKYLF